MKTLRYLRSLLFKCNWNREQFLRLFFVGGELDVAVGDGAADGGGEGSIDAFDGAPQDSSDLFGP